jgi:CubicO group peptidase (beta-lactamase class C family)
MKRNLKFAAVGAAVFLSLVTAALAWYLAKAMPIGAGFVAKYLCSSVFISQRDPAVVLREDIAPVNPLARLIDYRIERTPPAVTAHVFGRFARTAIYREGCGCTLVVGATEVELRAQQLIDPARQRDRPRQREDLPWPEGTQGPADPASMGVDPAGLAQALESAFGEPGPEPQRRTRAVVVVYDGRLVVERYAEGFHKEMPLLGWSMAKSATNALVGILVQQGRLDILRPAPVAEWGSAGDPRQPVSIDQLLRMSSGLAFKEVYAPLYDATRMLYGSPDMAAFAAAKPLEGPPDSRWNYSSGTANIVARIVRRTVEKDAPYYYRFMHAQLFDRIGMTSAVFEPDASGTFVGSSYLFATPRDWARFGLLYLQDGIWQGQRILPEGWVRYSATPTGGAPKGQYGAFFWLNAGAADNPSDRRWPDAPTDAFAALGFQEQQVIVIPSRKAVLVRLGATTRRETWNTNRFIREVLAALPVPP